MTQKDAADWIDSSTGRTIAPSTVGRLEELHEAPADRGRRRLAFLLSLLYKIDPAEFGLGGDDSPDEMTTARLRSRDLAVRSSGWSPPFAGCERRAA
jgi:hypothetical protein